MKLDFKYEKARFKGLIHFLLDYFDEHEIPVNVDFYNQGMEAYVWSDDVKMHLNYSVDMEYLKYSADNIINRLKNETNSK